MIQINCHASAIAICLLLFCATLGGCDMGGPAIEFMSVADTLEVTVVDDLPQTMIEIRSRADTTIRFAMDLVTNSGITAIDTLSIPRGFRGGISIFLPMKLSMIEGAALKIDPLGTGLSARTYQLMATSD